MLSVCVLPAPAVLPDVADALETGCNDLRIVSDLSQQCLGLVPIRAESNFVGAQGRPAAAEPHAGVGAGYEAML
jgi:hypothetical protein